MSESYKVVLKSVDHKVIEAVDGYDTENKFMEIKKMSVFFVGCGNADKEWPRRGEEIENTARHKSSLRAVILRVLFINIVLKEVWLPKPFKRRF